MCLGCNTALVNFMKTAYTRREFLVGTGLLATGLGLENLSESPAWADTKPNGEQGGDLIFFGGPILTIVEKQPETEALAVRGGKIIAVGDRKEVLKSQTKSTKMIDLQGRAVMPGFVEPHLHLTMSALAHLRSVDVSPLQVRSKKEVLRVLKNAAQKGKEGEWIIGFGYDPSLLPPDYPSLTADDLDGVSQANPVFVLNQSGHIAYVNHKAFEVAKITDGTPNPPQGTYVKDKKGKLTGELFETPSYLAFMKSFPKLTYEELRNDCRKMVREWARQGCTTVYDAGLGLVWGEQEVRLFLDLAKDPSTPVRFRTALAYLFDPKKMGIVAGQGDDRLKFLGMKYWADGSTQGFTGALNEPYLNDMGKGALNFEKDEDLLARVQASHEAGWQILIHSNGDRATDQVLRVYAEVLKKSPNSKHRHRIEHFTVTVDEQLARAKKLGLSISHTLGHVYYWGNTLRDHVLGKKRASRIDPLASDFRHGLIASTHSDSPVSPVEPLRHVQTAVTRLTREGSLLGKDERITIDQALKIVTQYPAYQSFLDDKVGTLEVGKLADLVILDQNPRKVDPGEIAKIKVLETYLAGVKQSWS